MFFIKLNVVVKISGFVVIIHLCSATLQKFIAAHESACVKKVTSSASEVPNCNGIAGRLLYNPKGIVRGWMAAANSNTTSEIKNNGV